MEAPPANLLVEFVPLDRSQRYVQGMDHLATSMGLELTDEQLGYACAWFLSYPHFGIQYLQELKADAISG